MTAQTLTSESLNSVLTAAAAAKPVLAAQSPQQRYGQLTAVADGLDAAAEELVPVAMAESHLPEARLRGELRRTTMQLRLFAEEAREGRFLDVRIDVPDPDFGSGPRPDIRRMRRPIGVVLNFAASNFPFAFSVAGGDTASALGAGCPVIVKAHEGHPELSARTAEIVHSALTGAGAPAGTFDIIYGREIGVAALSDDRVDAATFTGSVRGGLALADIAARRARPIPFYGELGSINPVVVTPAAIAARGADIAQGFVDSFTLGSGQFCTKPGLVFLPAGHGLDDVLATAAAGKPAGELLTEAITAGFAARLADLVGSLGGRLLAESRLIDGNPSPGLLVIDYPTFEQHRNNAMTEVFGPFAIIVEYRDASEIASAIEQLEGSLTLTIQAEESDSALVGSLLSSIEQKAGRILVNDWPTGVSVTPAQHHGGPYPSTTNPLHTAVGTAAIERFLRPVTYQNFYGPWLPEPLRDDNPWNVPQNRSDAGQSQHWGRR
ncbi:aldehyde dehydrogenase (NADP(+)) [Mycobacterium aquaticum]|uniref:aldehyde dehydrogenase (NADP(+)) n=1 Tax=Mycobacterium aquaticum TaxID=1927124 RepID=UPI001FE53043|nr:aldehyde dehydrogenase (NADP(+)) [Mycobacterium aquaticum]